MGWDGMDVVPGLLLLRRRRRRMGHWHVNNNNNIINPIRVGYYLSIQKCCPVLAFLMVLHGGYRRITFLGGRYTPSSPFPAGILPSNPKIFESEFDISAILFKPGSGIRILSAAAVAAGE